MAVSSVLILGAQLEAIAMSPPPSIKEQDESEVGVVVHPQHDPARYMGTLVEALSILGKVEDAVKVCVRWGGERVCICVYVHVCTVCVSAYMGIDECMCVGVGVAILWDLSLCTCNVLHAHTHTHTYTHTHTHTHTHTGNSGSYGEGAISGD